MGAAESSGRGSSDLTTFPRSVSQQETPGFLPEILEHLASFLVGYDVLQLAHACRSFRDALAAPDVWRTRVSPLHGRVDAFAAWSAEQSAYFHARSLLFHGLDAVPHKLHGAKKLLSRLRRQTKTDAQCGDVWELPYALLPIHGLVSFELWFSLVHDDAGGVLFGAQSASCFTPGVTPVHHQFFVHVDPSRNLYCSVLPSKPVVAHHLDTNRWYHVALTFDSRRQCVYLDGELVNSSVGLEAHKKWHWVRHAQLGSGFVSSSAASVKPSPDFAGWFPFLGVIDDFRVWPHVLLHEDVRRLAARQDLGISAMYTLSTDKIERHVGVRSIKCSRPQERTLVVHHARALGDRLSSSERPSELVAE